MIQLLYFANPMCSWCWGFAPVMRHLREAYRDRAQITVVLGALGRGDRPMRDVDKAEVSRHWEHVAELTGQPFDRTFFDREGFVYDTEPACRGIALLRARFPDLALDMLHRLQERFYAHNEDITDQDAVAQTCSEFGLGREDARTALEDPALVDGVRREFRDVAGLGVTGYPTLLALTKPKPKVVSIGCRPCEDVVRDLDLALTESAS